MGAVPQYKLTASFDFWEEIEIEGLRTKGEMSEAVCLFGHIFEFEREVYTWLDVVV